MNIQKEVSRWATDQFGQSSAVAKAIRGNKEMAELISSLQNGIPNDEIAEECADVAFFLLQICEASGHDLMEEVARKLEINKKRQWKRASDGSHQHV